MARTQLPYDVWECISVYIPQWHLRTLYGVNRALHRAAMNSKYRRVHFSDFDDEKMRCLRRLQDPIVGRRVQSLHVDAFAVFTSHHKRDSTIYSSNEILQAMTAAISAMTNIQEFHVNWRCHYFSHDLIPFFHAAWKAVAPTLRLLYLAAPGGRFRTLLDMATHHRFPSLQSVELVVDRVDATYGDNTQQLLSQFLRNSRTTLRNLVVRSHIDLAATMASLPTFPRLRKLAVVIPVLTSDTLVRFVTDHAETMIDLEWGISSMDVDDPETDTRELDQFVKTLCTYDELAGLKTLGLFVSSFSFGGSMSVVQRNLTTLTQLFVNGLALDVDHITALADIYKHGGVLEDLGIRVQELSLDVVEKLSRFPPSLQSIELSFLQMLPVELWSIEGLPAPSPSPHCLRRLDVRGISMYLSLEGVQALLAAFAHYLRITPTLESLQLIVHKLNPQLVDVLSVSVPNLRSLDLHILELKGEKDDGERWMRCLGAFGADMKSRKYTQWRLEEVSVTSTYFDGTTVRKREHMDIVEVLAASIPSMLAMG